MCFIIDRTQKSPLFMRTLISFMVMRTGFEPVNAALRGQCVKPLHQRTR